MYHSHVPTIGLGEDKNAGPHSCFKEQPSLPLPVSIKKYIIADAHSKWFCGNTVFVSFVSVCVVCVVYVLV